jgi:hypothetical protein
MRTRQIIKDKKKISLPISDFDKETVKTINVKFSCN